MPMLIPLMYFMTMGYRRLFEKYGRDSRVGKVFCYAVCIAMAAFLIYCYLFLVLPSCGIKWKKYLIGR